MTEFTTIRLSQPQPHLQQITLARPQAANALNHQMALELRKALEDNAEDAQLRALILTGEGGRAFCAGADLKERQGMDESSWHMQHHAFEQMLHALTQMPVPVIAAVNGAAFGGGLEIVLACDLVYAADSSRFAFPEARLGIMPGLGGTQNLPRAIGIRRAREILFTGNPFTAQEGLEWGLINAVYPDTRLLAEVTRIAGQIASNAPLSLRRIKAAVQHGTQMSLSEGMRYEMEAYWRLIPTQDRREGIQAFNEKRPPVFKGV